MKGKCILLVRVSTNSQDITQQTEKVKNEALKDGYNENNIIILEDKESAVKLSEEERNGLNRLKWHIEHEKIDCVYVYEVSRISRQPATLYKIRDFLIKHNTQLIIMEPYIKMLKDDGTLSETGNIFFGMFASMAENEGFIRKARLKRGKEKKKKLGMHVDGVAPVGYRIVEHRLTIHEEEAQLVRDIYKKYAYDNFSMGMLAKELVDMGFRGSDNVDTMRQNVKNILKKEYYCGDETHPQIISREVYEAAQTRKQNKIYYKKKYDEALCKGLMIDVGSGKYLIANISNRQYTVRGKRDNSVRASISMPAADTLVSGLVEEWYNIISKTKIEEIRDKIKSDIEYNKKVVETMQNNITTNQDKIDRIEERYIDGKISKEKADELERKAFEQLQYYRRTLNEAQDNINKFSMELSNATINVSSLRDKALYVIEKIYIKRLSKYVVEMKIINKWTGEVRTYEYNTMKRTILHMDVKLRATLGMPK